MLLLGSGLRWLAGRRWFGDKGRSITSAAIDDLTIEWVGERFLALVLIRLRFADAEDALYFLPLASRDDAPEAEPIGSIRLSDRSLILVDATETAWFGRWLLDHMAERSTVDGPGLRFTVAPEARSILDQARRWPARLMGAEQSNTSMRFGDALILKLFRRLQPGPSPEQEALASLTALQVPFVPAFVGSASWRSAVARSIRSRWD